MTGSLEWTNQMCREFLDLYESESVIWNPLHENYKNRKENYNAWDRIQEGLSFECSMDDLKKKKESMMASYRFLKQKILRSKVGAAPGENQPEEFVPSWFAFAKMDSFLSQIYTPKMLLNDVLLNDVNTHPCNNNDSLTNRDYKREAIKRKVDANLETLETIWTEKREGKKKKDAVNGEPEKQPEISKQNTKICKIVDFQTELLKLYNNIASSRQSSVNEYDAIGITVSKKLERMNPTQALYAELIINKVLQKGLLNKLSEYSDLCNNNCGNILEPETITLETESSYGG